jgi:hypothetical protein
MTEGGSGAYEYNMQTWSLEELLIANPLSDSFSMADAHFLFDVFGGCVRYFLPSGSQPEAIDDYIHRSALWFFGSEREKENPYIWHWAMSTIRSRINMFVPAYRGSYAVALAVQSLFIDPHIITPDRRTYIVGYMSRFMRFLAGCLSDGAEATLWDALKDGFPRAGRVVTFESIGHKTLVATAQEFVATNLNRVRKNRTFAKCFYQMRRVLLRNVDEIEQLPDDQYGLPLFCNFALVDVVIQPNVLLQFTIYKTHGVDSDAERYAGLRSKLRGPHDSHKLIFVLKPENLADFQPVGIPADLACFKMAYTMLPSKKAKR